MSVVSREVRLVRVPEGLPRPEDFELVEVPVPEVGDGEALVRNLFLLVSPALRTLIGGGLEGAPLPTVRPGEPLIGMAVGEIVEARGDGVRPGDLVVHYQGYREYAILPLEQCAPLGGELPDPAAYLSQGRVAYAALTRGAGLREGDTVFVSGGAGAIGSMAGQIARLLGAGRVIGSTGSPEKAERMKAELGYDAVVVRGAGPIADQLAAAAPDGIDVFLDNVGGEQLRAATEVARDRARFVLVGALSGQLAPESAGAEAPVGLDSYTIILRRIELRGFSALDHPEAAGEWLKRFGGWLRAGEITFPRVRISGIERASQAFLEVLGGRHLGAVIVEL